jgi:hypothetical protein
VVATMFVAPGQQTSLSSQSLELQVRPQHFVVSRLGRLEDGMFSPVSMSARRLNFRHV